MSRRRGKRHAKRPRGPGATRNAGSQRTAPVEQRSAGTTGPGTSGPGLSSGPGFSGPGTSPSGAVAAPPRTHAAPRERITPWRETLHTLLDGVRAFARSRHGEAVEAVIRAQLGDAAETAHPGDIERLLDELICTPGTGGDGRSIAAVYAEQAPDLPDLERDQLRRWERERARGVFLVQRCHTDRIEAWDPIEGAALTLHLLDRLPAGRAAEVRAGSVLTATYLPHVARLVAVGLVEFFLGPDALALFRDNVRQGAVAWHEPPPPAPTPRG